MELKTFFDPKFGEKAHQDTILAGPVLPKGLDAPFEHAWGYLDKEGEMEYHKHYKEEIYFFLAAGTKRKNLFYKCQTKYY